MPRFIDLTGIRFGNLTVARKVGSDKHGNVIWETVCDCGRIKIKSALSLRRGEGLHCDFCPRKQREPMKSRVGQVFGRFTIVSFSHVRPKRGSVWNCLCECGTSKKILDTVLVSGHTRSCGCLREDMWKSGGSNLTHGHTRGGKATPEYNLWMEAKRRAKKGGVLFDLSLDDIHVPEFCPLLGIPLVVGDKITSKQSPSLDRLIPSNGYTKNNVWVISHRANTIKNDASIQEIERIAQNLRRKVDELNGDTSENQQSSQSLRTSSYRTEYTLPFSGEDGVFLPA